MSWLDKWEKATHATKAGVIAAQRISLAIDDADVTEIIESHSSERQPKRRSMIVKKYRSYVENDRARELGKPIDKPAKNPHDAAYACCCFAWREILGGLIAGDFIHELCKAFYDSYEPALWDRTSDPKNFAKIASDSLGTVLGELGQYNPDNPNDPDDPAIQKYLKDRANRNFGSHHLDEINTAPVLDDSAFSLNGHSSTYDPWDWIETSDEIGNELLSLAFDAADSLSNAKEKEEVKSESIFREYGPTEWAKPVEPLEFLIGQALCRDTWGPNAGPKKSLKTHDTIAIAMSIATGINLYRSELFPVHHQGKALLIIGEGGEKQIFRLLHRMCRAYGIKVEDVLNDPAFPLIVEFGVAPLDSDDLRDEIKMLLDRHQPDLVGMESFYNFHPSEVSAANLYERGPVIDSYHKLVREGGSDVVSLLTDHYRSTAGKTLDLDNISMAGQAENADSWITRYHAKTPDVLLGDFSLHVGFGSRHWSGSEWIIDWHVGPFDHKEGCHTGEISWDVRKAIHKTAITDDEPPKILFATDEELQNHMRSYVDAHPNMSPTAMLDALAKDTKIVRKRLKENWAKAEETGKIYVRSVTREETDPRDKTKTRDVTRRVCFPGSGRATVAESRQIWGAD